MNLASKVSNDLRKYVGFSFINGKWVLCGTTEDASVARHWDEDPKREVFLCHKVDVNRIIDETANYYPVSEDTNIRQYLHKFLERLCS